MVQLTVDEQPRHQPPSSKRLAEGPAGAHIVVGCALLPKKVQRYLTPRMLQAAAEHNILLKQIDYSRPLAPQGPFDVIIHKLRPNPGWEQQLRQYAADNPQVVVVDRLDKIRQLHNRATMLRPLQGEGIMLQQPLPQAPAMSQQHHSGPAACTAVPAIQHQQQQQGRVVRVQAPLQVEIAEGTTEAQAQAALAAAGLAPPLLCKPLWTDGRDGSHKLAVLHDLEALGRLLRGAVCHEFKPPLVVQQFVEHGGVLFKVYVLGSQTYVTARPSLGETVLEPAHAVQQLPRISCVSVFSKQQQHKQHMQAPPAALSAAEAAAAAHTAPTQASTACRSAGQPQHRESAALHGQKQEHLQSQQGQQRHPQVQSAALAAVTAQSVWRPPSSIVAPPAWLTTALAATLRQELGMQLFNFDLIVPEQQQTEGLQEQQQDNPDASPPLCYVVDINFFPGVDKIPDFEQRFVAFLLAAAAAGQPAGVDCAPTQQQQQPCTAPAALGCGAAVAQTGSVTAGPAAGLSSISKAKQDGLGVNSSSSSSSRDVASSDGTGSLSSTHDALQRRSSSSGVAEVLSGSRRLQHSLSAGRNAPLAAAAAAAGSGGQHGRRHSSSGLSGSRHGSGLGTAAAVASSQWGDRAAVLGSSPPPQLQVAGCS